jgi:hypothetical protein
LGEVVERHTGAADIGHVSDWVDRFVVASGDGGSVGSEEFGGDVAAVVFVVKGE